MVENSIGELRELDRKPGFGFLQAEPDAIEIEWQKTGILIVDVQNAFMSKNAYFDLMGYDVNAGRIIIEPIRKISNAARRKGIKIIYAYTVHYPGDAGTGPDSVFWHKEASLVYYRDHPEQADNLLLPGTWGAEIIEELRPREGDVLLEKSRYSAFYDTNLDTVLKRFDIKYIITVGLCSNCCVEALLRDAYYRGYFGIMVSDATAACGPEFMQEASLFNIKTFYGWTVSAEDFFRALK